MSQIITDTDGNEVEVFTVEELEQQKQNVNFERLPALKMEENKLTSVLVDFSKPFENWTDPATGKIKKMVTVTDDGTKKIWWLNVQNPVYREMLEAHQKNAQVVFKLLRTGQLKATKYAIVKE